MSTPAASLDALIDALGDVPHERGAPLAKKTTFGIGGPADVLVTARSDDELLRVLALAAEHAQPVFLLGGGSNLLVGDKGVRGVTLVLGGELAAIEVRDEGAAIVVGCGATYPRLTRKALDLGWPPAIGWIGTPGTVGGALKMNAGTRHGEIGDVVVEVHGMTADGPVRFSKEDCGFSYRKSKFPTRVVLTRAFLRCDDRRSDEAGELDRVAKELLAKRHASQPKQRSAGSIFKNPPGDYAGRLIEAAGLKGFTVGRARISEVHANFVVNLGGASAKDVVTVAEHAASVVREKFGVDLEWEVRRVGEFD